MSKKVKILTLVFILMIITVFIVKCNSHKVNEAYSYYKYLQQVDSVSSPIVYKDAKADFVNVACNLNERDFEKLKSMINEYKKKKVSLKKDKSERMDSINKMLR
jgi:hypothetical protein|nr:MAG TPA: protein of unknown function (DUF4972) [Crassvirales sp.]